MAPSICGTGFYRDVGEGDTKQKLLCIPLPMVLVNWHWKK